MAIQRRLVEAVEVTENRVHVIRLKNIFDASTVNEFEKVVSYLLSRNFYKVVVDLGHVEFISSAGWGAFTADLRRVRENQGDIKLANMSPDVCDVFLLLELDSFIKSFDAVDEAIAAFSQPAVAPEPGPARPSILQEIKAASRSREMAEAGARTAAEKPAPDFSERWRERTVTGPETYAPAYAAPASEKTIFAGASHDHARVDKRIERSVVSPAPVFDAESTYGDSPYLFHDQYGTAEQPEDAGDDHASETGQENFPVESDVESGTAEQAEYTGDDYASEGEYENYSAESDDENGVTEQAEYAGDDYASEGEYESYSAESDGESDVAEQAEYTGDDHASEGEYENYSAGSDDENGVTEQAEYAGDDYASEGEYESYSAESDGESDVAEQAEYAGDVSANETEYENASDEADEAEYEDASDEYDGEDGAAERAEYAGDVYADETEYEDASDEYDGEDGAAERAEYAGDVYADETQYEDASAEPSGEDDAAEQAEYAGDEYASESEYVSSSTGSDDGYGAVEDEGRDVNARNEYATADELDASDSVHAMPPAQKPFRAANGPEMWELILAGGTAPIDPYMFKKSARVLPEVEKPQAPFASGATPPFSDQPSEDDSSAGAQSESAAPAANLNADNASEEFAGLGAAPDWGFAGHEPYVEDNSRTGAGSEPVPKETGFAHAHAKASPGDGDDEEFDEFETQDIRDPWILEEIDTLPEEYEMEGGAADGAEPSFSASELLSYDLELDASFSPLPEPVRDHDQVETAGESTAQFAALPQAGVDDSFGNLRDENLAAPGDDSLDPPAKSAKKKAARTRKSKPRRKRAKPSRSGEGEAPITPESESVAPFQSGAAASDEDLPAYADDEEAQSEATFASSAETPAFLQENDSAENFFAPPALDEHGELIARVSPPLSSHNGNDETSHDHPPDEALPKIPASGNLEEIVRAVVATHPEFGAAMICKFIEDRFEPPVFISQSAVYRLLREAQLNTREKRQAYANQLFDPSVLAGAI